MIESRPPRAAILFAGASMLQLPTPTPGGTELPLSEVERIINTASNQAKELSLQQMVFVVIVLLIVFGIAMAIWLIRRPNKPKAEQTVAEISAELVTAARQDAKEAQQKLIEQNDKFIETAVVMSDAVTQNADNGKQLNSLVDRLSTHVEQLAGRQNERDKKLESMSSALETMVHQGSEPLRQLITDVAALVKKIDNVQCGQDELKGAIEVLTNALKTCEKKAEDTGKVATVSELDADAKPADDAAA